MCKSYCFESIYLCFPYYKLSLILRSCLCVCSGVIGAIFDPQASCSGTTSASDTRQRKWTIARELKATMERKRIKWSDDIRGATHLLIVLTGGMLANVSVTEEITRISKQTEQPFILVYSTEKDTAWDFGSDEATGASAALQKLFADHEAMPYRPFTPKERRYEHEAMVTEIIKRLSRLSKRLRCDLTLLKPGAVLWIKYRTANRSSEAGVAWRKIKVIREGTSKESRHHRRGRLLKGVFVLEKGMEKFFLHGRFLEISRIKPSLDTE